MVGDQPPTEKVFRQPDMPLLSAHCGQKKKGSRKGGDSRWLLDKVS